MKLAIVTALAAIIVTPWTLSENASAQTTSQQTVQKKKVTVAKPAVRRASPYSSEFYNPSYDVYVKGAYVGSDPDPRIRWTLEREAKGGYAFK